MRRLPTLADRPRCATPKKAKQRLTSKQVKAVRAHVFARERDICRCCGWREAESMHEVKPKSLGGEVSPENSIAVCGSGTTGCHGFLQRNQIHVRFDKHRSAERWMAFRALTVQAAEHMAITFSTERASEPLEMQK